MLYWTVWRKFVLWLWWYISYRHNATSRPLFMCEGDAFLGHVICCYTAPCIWNQYYCMSWIPFDRANPMCDFTNDAVDPGDYFTKDLSFVVKNGWNISVVISELWLRDAYNILHMPRELAVVTCAKIEAIGLRSDISYRIIFVLDLNCVRKITIGKEPSFNVYMACDISVIYMLQRFEPIQNSWCFFIKQHTQNVRSMSGDVFMP